MTLRGMYVNQSCKMEISVMCYVTCSDVIVIDVHLVSCFTSDTKCHGLTLLNIKSEDTMACCAQQIMYRMTKGIRFLL